MTDLIIIGGGIAGITASIYAKNKGMDVILIDNGMVGGALNYINEITNFPGYTKISGNELAFKLYEQVKSNEINFQNTTIKKINKLTDSYEVITNKNTYVTKKILIATGRKPRELGLPNEKELLGHGISYCAICDGPMYQNKDVCVIGGGNKALHEALYLANICKTVYLIHRRDCFKADDALVDNAKTKNNIIFIMSEEVKGIEKDNELLKVTLNNNVLDVNAVFVAIGNIPNTDVINDLDVLTDHSYIIVNDQYETNINNIYAAGDCIKKEVYQLVAAASEGASAILNMK